MRGCTPRALVPVTGRGRRPPIRAGATTGRWRRHAIGVRDEGGQGASCPIPQARWLRGSLPLLSRGATAGSICSTTSCLSQPGSVAWIRPHGARLDEALPARVGGLSCRGQTGPGEGWRASSAQSVASQASGPHERSSLLHEENLSNMGRKTPQFCTLRAADPTHCRAAHPHHV